MIYFLYLFLMVIIYNYLDFWYLRQKLKFRNNELRLKHKTFLRFIICVLILWSFIVLSIIYFSYKEAILVGYGKTPIIMVTGVLLVWSAPIYVKLFSLYNNLRCFDMGRK